MCSTDCGTRYKFNSKVFGDGTPMRCVDNCFKVTRNNTSVTVSRLLFRDTLTHKCVLPKDCPEKHVDLRDGPDEDNNGLCSDPCTTDEYKYDLG